MITDEKTLCSEYFSVDNDFCTQITNMYILLTTAASCMAALIVALPVVDFVFVPRRIAPSLSQGAVVLLAFGAGNNS
jgi:hypothetical protein